MPKGIYLRKPINERFWSKINKLGPEDCWEWKGSFRGKYGQIRVNKKQYSAHRFSWILHNGHPGDLWVLHKCDNVKCVNPNHLFLGTAKENTHDMINKGRKPIGTNHKSSKLTNSEIYAIRSSKMKQRELAEIYGVDQTQISNIKNKKQWKHL